MRASLFVAFRGEGEAFLLQIISSNMHIMRDLSRECLIFDKKFM
jgi:hypothetical protein